MEDIAVVHEAFVIGLQQLEGINQSSCSKHLYHRYIRGNHFPDERVKRIRDEIVRPCVSV